MNLQVTLALDGYKPIQMRVPVSDDFGDFAVSEVLRLLSEALHELVLSGREAEDPTLREQTLEASDRRWELSTGELHLNDLWNERTKEAVA